MSNQPIQDTISLDLAAEKTVVNDTIKVIATISALIRPDQTDATLRADIRAMMKKLIETAEWQFSNLERSTDPSGVERVQITASARVSEGENANLEGRARDVSSPGLTVANVQVDTTIPQRMLDEAEQALRMDLLAKINQELAKINEVMKDDKLQPYRVYQVKFQRSATDLSNAFSKNGRVGATMLAASASYGSGFDEEGVLGNAQKLTMHASIHFARVLYN